MDYIAIIGDIYGSRTLSNRGAVQSRLKHILQSVNLKYANEIAAQFMITLGDEFQGLLNTGIHTMNIIEEIQAQFYPVRIRFGIGIGAVTTLLSESDTLVGIETRELDGPCYYNARSAIDYLKKSEKQKKNDSGNIRIEMEHDADGFTELMNSTLSLMSVIEQNWTPRQRTIINDYMIYQDGQKNVAERLEIAQSSVQRGLANSNFYAYAQAIKTINGILGEIQK